LKKAFRNAWQSSFGKALPGAEVRFFAARCDQDELFRRAGRIEELDGDFQTVEEALAAF